MAHTDPSGHHTPPMGCDTSIISTIPHELDSTEDNTLADVETDDLPHYGIGLRTNDTPLKTLGGDIPHEQSNCYTIARAMVQDIVVTDDVIIKDVIKYIEWASLLTTNSGLRLSHSCIINFAPFFKPQPSGASASHIPGRARK
ncbi:hypothetical protein VUR80DRAFT_2934 [Thermomyces stellatus]